MRAAAGAGYSTATDLADWLVREAGLPFREAHHVTGRIVAEAARRGVALDALPLDGDAGRPSGDHGRRFRRALGRGLGRQPHAARAAPRRRMCAPPRAAWIERLQGREPAENPDA